MCISGSVHEKLSQKTWEMSSNRGTSFIRLITDFVVLHITDNSINVYCIDGMNGSIARLMSE